MRADLRSAAAAAALILAPAAAGAQDSYANAPFNDVPVPLAQAAALDRIEGFARAVAAAGPGATADDDDDDAAAVAQSGDNEDQVGGEDDDDEEGGPLLDLAFFSGSLAAVAPDLAQELGEAVEAMTQGGPGAAEAAARVVPLAEQARPKLLKPEIADAAPFRAALMASLLLDEGGVAEGYEEAVGGEALAYGTGYFALQRVKSLWDGLAPAASPEQAANVGEMLAMLDSLFPTATLPDTLAADPEQAEAPAQQLVGLLEATANADLYPGRDIAGAAARVHDIAASGCKALAAGDTGTGAEALTIAAAYYGSTVGDTLGVMAPDAAEAVEHGLDAVGESDPAEAAEACPALLDALATGQKALTP